MTKRGMNPLWLVPIVYGILAIIIIIAAYLMGSFDFQVDAKCKKQYGQDYVVAQVKGGLCVAPDGTGRYLR